MRSTYHPISLALVAVLALMPIATAQAAAKSRHVEPTLLIEGAGDGHGVGMSQWGALGYAQHGWDYQSILAHYYSGTALGAVSQKRVVKVLVGNRVRKVPIEAYVRGVIAAEMPSSWPKAALEAQAIASRTFAITDDAGGSRFDVYSDTRSQVYLGKAAETTASNEAVRATAGQVVTYQGKPVITYFFSSSGGRTESIQNSFLGASPQPWLKGVLDPYDGGPLHHWSVKFSFGEAAQCLQGLIKGSFEGIEVLKRGFSPRIILAEVLGSKGKTQLSGPELAGRLGLDDAWAYFSVQRNGKTTKEPDLSGPPPAGEESSPPPPPPPPPTTGAQGGVRAPSRA
jgi:stage II sporulation protein D